MNRPDADPKARVALFQKREIRRTLHNNEWWFAIVDVVAVLTDSTNPSGYLKDMRRRDPSLAEGFKGGGANCPPSCAGVRDGRRPAEDPLLEHRGPLPPHPVYSQPQGRTVQALAGASGQGAA